MAFEFTHWPTEFPGRAYITQTFGANPNYYSKFKLPGHEGIDFHAPSGSSIFALAKGTVRDINHTGLLPSGATHAYGVFVRIDHEDGYQTTYAHLERPLVAVGEWVLGGQLIGLADNTGNIKSGSSHLHVTLKRFPTGQPGWKSNIVDPRPFLEQLLTSPGVRRLMTESVDDVQQLRFLVEYWEKQAMNFRSLYLMAAKPTSPTPEQKPL